MDKEEIKLSFIRASSILCFFLLFSTSVLADTALIYHSSYSDAHTNVKSQLEADGYTVTMSTSGSIADNLYTHNIDGTSGGYDVVVDLKYNNNIGSNGRSRYQSFVQAGGVLIVTGENETNFSSRNNNIENLISNKFSGSLTMSNVTGYVDSLNSTYTNSSIDSGSNMMYIAGGASLSGDGQWVAKIGSTVVWMVWEGDDLPSGYDGAVYVTGDINQFTSSYMANGCSTNCTVMNVVSDAVEYSTADTTISITSGQTTIKSGATSRTYSSNTIRITQSGTNLDLNIVQKGEGNFIEGSDFNSVATLTGDDLTITLEQGSNSLGASNNNGIGIDVDGDANTVLIRQGTMGNSDSGGHKAKVNIDGNTNSLTLYQYNSGASSSNHFSHIDILGGQNTITSYQRDNNSKDLFIDLDGSSNTVSTDQKDSGNHYLDLDINGNSHTITTTQQGSGDHGARISVTNSGGASTVTLDQNSSTNQNYTLTQDCTNSNGCSTTVTQN